MALESGERSDPYRSRYGIDKLEDGNYQSWAWNCKLLLQEREVWDVVDGSYPQPKPTTGPDETVVEPKASDVQAWDKKNQEALRIISFTVTERVQGPIRMGTTAKGAWDRLRNVHASTDKQRKFGLLKQLYRLDMAPGSSLIEHERLFNGLVESLATMGKIMETEDLVVIYANSLPPAEYRTWLQGQTAVLE